MWVGGEEGGGGARGIKKESKWRSSSSNSGVRGGTVSHEYQVKEVGSLVG